MRHCRCQRKAIAGDELPRKRVKSLHLPRLTLAAKRALSRHLRQLARSCGAATTNTTKGIPEQAHDAGQPIRRLLTALHCPIIGDSQEPQHHSGRRTDCTRRLSRTISSV